MVTLEGLIELALAEDLSFGDMTTDILLAPSVLEGPAQGNRQAQLEGTGVIASQQPGVLSGLTVAQAVFKRVDLSLAVELLQADGDCVGKGEPLMRVFGPMASILKAERVALNFLGHLSGVATLTYQYMATISQTKAKLTHTRKTLPGLRRLESQAVVHGGGVPHRYSLSHAVMVKDNHIAAVGSITEAVARLKTRLGHTTKIEVECDTLAQVEEAVRAGVDIVLLDNMTPDQLRTAVKAVHGRAITEASGGVTLNTVLPIAQSGVDYISTSEITLSAPAFDVNLTLDSTVP